MSKVRLILFHPLTLFSITRSIHNVALLHMDLTFHSDRFFEYNFKTIKCAYILDKDEKLIKLSEKIKSDRHDAEFYKSVTI